MFNSMTLTWWLGEATDCGWGKYKRNELSEEYHTGTRPKVSRLSLADSEKLHCGYQYQLYQYDQSYGHADMATIRPRDIRSHTTTTGLPCLWTRTTVTTELQFISYL